MDIGVSLKDLGAYDIEPLKQTILSLPEDAWWGNQFRQLEYEVHQHTQSIVMVFTDGQGWPNIEVSKDIGWDLLADTAIPLMHQILGEHYPAGGTIIRAMAARLEAGGIIKPHHDKHPSFHAGHRIGHARRPHVPWQLIGRQSQSSDRGF